MRAAETIGRVDVRRKRADAISHWLFQIIGDYVPRRFHQEVFDQLHRQIAAHGYEMLSDYDRQQHGLPARGPDGWTVEEIIALEHARLEALMRPIGLTTQKPPA